MITLNDTIAIILLTGINWHSKWRSFSDLLWGRLLHVGDHRLLSWGWRRILHPSYQRCRNVRLHCLPDYSAWVLFECISTKLLLSEPVSWSKNKFKDRAFSFVAPKLWNRLDESVRNAITLDSFKKKLKTHLFQKFYQS